MKTPEDEAFDELAKKQGAWGGGFHAKKAMAVDKFIAAEEHMTTNPCKEGTCDCCWKHLDEPAQEPTSGDYALGYAEGFNDACKKPAQEPVATLEDLEQEIYENTREFVPRNVMEWMFKRYYTYPPKRERVVFPTMLRKMWSGGEVQAWLDENVNKEKNG
jgi:hypothetical protein